MRIDQWTVTPLKNERTGESILYWVLRVQHCQAGKNTCVSIELLVVSRSNFKMKRWFESKLGSNRWKVHKIRLKLFTKVVRLKSLHFLCKCNFHRSLWISACKKTFLNRFHTLGKRLYLHKKTTA